jgi:murein DD-endopeptidase MepM/ murein hydrolase activator NlpD
MALPILAKGITSALVKKGKSAKKDDKVSSQKLLPSSTTSSTKSRAQFSKVEPRKLAPYRKKVETTKFLPPSKVDEKFDINKLGDLLTSLVGSTANLQKITKKDLGDVKKDNRSKDNIKQKSKRQRNEEKTESKKTVAKVSRPMKLTVPSLFKDIFKMGGRLILSLGIMELLKFLDPEKKESIFGFLTEHLDKIILGTLGILGITFVASFLPVISMVGTILSIVSPIIFGMVGIITNPAVLTVLGLLAGGMLLKELLYKLEGPAREFYEEKVAPFVDEAYYGDRADEGGFITKLRDNYGRISKKEDRDKLTDKEKTTQQFLRIYDEKLKELKRAKDKAKPGAFKGSGGSEEVKRLEDELTQMAEQLKIGGKTLAELQAEFEKDGSLPQTSITKSQTPQAQPQTEMIPQSGLPALPPTGTDPTHGAAQMYGAARGGGSRRHAGQDFDAGPNDTFYSRIGGEVIYSANAGGGYGNVVDVYNKELGVTERIAEGDSNLVSIGDIIKPGTSVQKGTAQTGVFHYEIRKGRAGASGSFSGTVDPIEFLKNLPTKTKVEPVSQSPPNKAQKVSSTASYEETGTQVAMIQVPLPVPMPSPGGGGGTSSGGSRGSGGYDIDSIILGQSFSNA